MILKAQSQPPTLASYLRDQRQRQRLSQREMATLLGMGRETWRKIEAGTYRRLEVEHLKAIARELHVPLLMLFALILAENPVPTGTSRQQDLEHLLLTLETTTQQLRTAMRPGRRPRPYPLTNGY